MPLVVFQTQTEIIDTILAPTQMSCLVIVSWQTESSSFVFEPSLMAVFERQKELHYNLTIHWIVTCALSVPVKIHNAQTNNNEFTTIFTFWHENELFSWKKSSNEKKQKQFVFTKKWGCLHVSINFEVLAKLITSSNEIKCRGSQSLWHHLIV